jgi:hypothetical protein
MYKEWQGQKISKGKSARSCRYAERKGDESLVRKYEPKRKVTNTVVKAETIIWTCQAPLFIDSLCLVRYVSST